MLKIIKSVIDGSFSEKLRKTIDYYIKQHIQNIWFLTSVPADHIGLGKGLLTWARLKKHNLLRRKIHIALLEYEPTNIYFGSLMTYWINERSKLCSASLNNRLEEADIVWIFSQDPMNEDIHSFLLDQMRQAKRAIRIINHPDHYNVYHQTDTFMRLAQAGVNVPKATFSIDEIGKTKVVYKQVGKQGADKTVELYQGDKEGYSPYAFIDSRGNDGLYRRYRAYYLVGIVRPSKLFRCTHWNVCLKSKPIIEYSFSMTLEEIQQVRLIAKTLKLDYFAVDFLRRCDDDKPFFTDINIYPDITSLKSVTVELGYYDAWHTFDNRNCLGIPEPGGRLFADVFDDAMLHFLEGNPFPRDLDKLN